MTSEEATGAGYKYGGLIVHMSAHTGSVFGDSSRKVTKWYL
jgi:hypothetical protein